MKVNIRLELDNVKNFISIVKTFESDINMKKGSYIIDAKSLMGVMSLDCRDGVMVEINSNNENEIQRFIEEMKQFT